MNPSLPSKIAEDFWGNAARGKMKGKYPAHWLESPIVLRHCENPRISGDSEVGWLEWVKRDAISHEVGSGFILGCGGGALERKPAWLGICRNSYCVDFSPQAVEVARALASREGWDRHPRDLPTTGLSSQVP